MKHLVKAAIKRGWSILVAYLSWMKKYAKHPEKYDIKEKYQKMHKFVKPIMKAFDADITVKGEENIPHETCCFLCNHLSMIDPVVFLATRVEPTTFVAKIEISKYPFVSSCVKDIEGEFINREDLKASLRTMMRVEASLKQRTKSWVIFPEGTRRKDDKLLLREFHHGTFRAPVKAQVPIVPVALFGTQRLLKDRKGLKKIPIYLEYGKPLYPSEYKDMSTQEIAIIIQSRVQQMISYNARRFDKNQMVKLLGDKYQENL